MFLLLITLAHGSCAATSELTIPRLTTLGPAQPVLATSSWGTGEHLARRLRLRGPDGALVPVRMEFLGRHARLVPKRPLTPGTYTVEERGDYDEEGHRIFLVSDPVHHAGWFPSWTVEVVTPTSPAGSLDVTWRHRPSAGGLPATPLLLGEVEATSEMAWVELQVDGVGSVDLAPHAIDGTFRLSTHAHRACNDTGVRMPLGDGDVTVRAVAHGPAGWTAASAWTTIGPSVEPSDRMGWPPVAGPPTGHAADVAKLTSWRRVRGSDTAPVVPPPSSCGPLRSVGKDVVPDGQALVDDDGRVHVLEKGADGWLIDGLPTELADEGAAAMGSHDGMRFVVEASEPRRLVRLDEGVRAASLDLPTTGRCDVRADRDGVELVCWERTHRRWRQRLTHDLVPLAEPATIPRPILAGQSTEGWFVNGTQVDGDYRRAHRSDDHVALATRSEVVVFDVEGTRVHAVPTPEGWHVDRVQVDADGVKMALEQRGDTQLQGFDWEGLPIDVAAVAPEIPAPSVLRDTWHFGERTLRRDGLRLFVEDPNGAASPPIPAQPNHGIGVHGDEVVIARRTYGADRAPELHIERFACSGEALGVPDRWMPQR